MLQIARPHGAAEANWLIYSQNLKPLVSQPPLLSCEVCVVVPVRNEAENLEATLQALTGQVDLNGKPLDRNRYEIIVLANNCSDDSANIARRFARTHPIAIHVVELTLSPEQAYIGWVRKRLMDEAYRRLASLGRDRGIIASTDGDTQVTPTWVAAIIDEINRGADAVGGRIITNPRERAALDSVTRLYFLRYVGYRYLVAQLEALLDPTPSDPVPRHHQNFGASLAVTAQVYAQAGGVPPVRTPEDVAFHQALERIDARFRHSPNVRVMTSARTIGRIKDGLAGRLTQLAALGHQRQPMLVESAQSVETRFRVRRQLRVLWQYSQNDRLLLPDLVDILASSLGIDSGWLADTIAVSPTFGLLVERIGKYQQDGDVCLWQKVDIQKAIADLRLKVNTASSNQQPFSSVLALNALKQIEPILLLPQPI